MTTLPLAQCARLLGIHPKTLHHWIEQAQFSVSAHPGDARLRCLTLHQLQQVAQQHGRPLPLAAPTTSELQEGPSEPFPFGQRPPQEGETLLAALPRSSEEDRLTQRLAALEKTVNTMQEQLAHLAVSLLHERDLRLEQRLSTLETLVEQRQEPAAQSPEPQELMQSASLPPECSLRPAPHPAEKRRRPVLPLIEYGKEGRYVVVCPKLGELPVVPDSPEWFAWLASLSSFRFVGKQGRFSACREYEHGPKRTWEGYRCFHQHMYKHYLGTTEHLTLATLEQMAATLQSEVTSL